MRNLKSIFVTGTCILGAFVTGIASAQTQISISTPATSWLVQNYIPQGLTLWYTGSSCASGQLVLPSSAVQADRDMLLGIVATSKATGIPVIVYYTVTSGICTISSFGLPAQ